MSTEPIDTVRAIELRDSAGKVLLRVPVSTPVPDTVTSEVKLGTNLDWYRDSTKWLVTTAGAAIVFGYGFAATIDSGRVELIAFTASSVALLISIYAGIQCHFWILSYANASESLPQTTDVSDKARLETTKARAKKRVPLYYKILIWPFFIGMSIFTLFCGYRIWKPKLTTGAPVITIASSSSNSPAVTTIVDQQTGFVWVLTDRGGRVSWQRFGLPTELRAKK
jgi:hypothetical protein